MKVYFVDLGKHIFLSITIISWWNMQQGNKENLTFKNRASYI